MIYVVDAHALIWFIIDSPRLGPAAEAALSASTSRLILPATAYAEACWIVERGRIPGYTVIDVQAALSADTRFTIHPLDRTVIDRSSALTAINEMHDRQIVATAMVLIDRGEEAALLTHDGNITDSGLVPTIW